MAQLERYLYSALSHHTHFVRVCVCVCVCQCVCINPNDDDVGGNDDGTDIRLR